jgi:1-phosphofructokinase
VIVTLTPNPSVDQTVTLEGPLTRGDVLRARSFAHQAGGKGVNISRAAVAADVATVAVVPCPAEDAFVVELEAQGVTCQPVATTASPRLNVTITEPDGTTTKVNSPGPVASTELLETLAAAVEKHAATASWVVLAGSLPPGAPATWYADLVTRVHPHAPVAVDTSDAPLAALVTRLGDARPALMKPNADELAAATGLDPESLQQPGAAASAAGRLVEAGLGACLVTLGAGGAVLVTAEGAWHAAPPPTTVVSTVGAGDSSLFGYLLADTRGLDAPDKLRLAVAYGSAAAGLPGTTIPTPTQARPDLVAVRALDHHLGGR